MTASKTKKPYRIEQHTTATNKQKYYLVRDIAVNGKRRKIRRYISAIKPTDKEIEQFKEKYANEIETEAVEIETRLILETCKINYLAQNTVEKLENTHVLYKRYAEILSVDENEVYEQNFEIKYVHGTTAIEGNTLTEEQTKNLLQKNVLPQDKQLREINEVQNFKNVKKYRGTYKGKINLNFIKKLHELIMNNIDYETLGQFRKVNVRIGGHEKPVMQHEHVELALLGLIDTYYENVKNGNHPFEEAALFHHKFESIHPFRDGNGRVGREIFNFMLNKNGYPKMLFLNERTIYLQILQLGDEEKYKEMLEHFAWLLIQQEKTVLLTNILKSIIPSKNKEQPITYNLPPQFIKGEET